MEVDGAGGWYYVVDEWIFSASYARVKHITAILTCDNRRHNKVPLMNTSAINDESVVEPLCSSYPIPLLLLSNSLSDIQPRKKVTTILTLCVIQPGFHSSLPTPTLFALNEV